MAILCIGPSKRNVSAVRRKGGKEFGSRVGGERLYLQEPCRRHVRRAPCNKRRDGQQGKHEGYGDHRGPKYRLSLRAFEHGAYFGHALHSTLNVLLKTAAD